MFVLNLFSLLAYVCLCLGADIRWDSGEINRLGEMAGFGMLAASLIFSFVEDNLRRSRTGRVPVSYFALMAPVILALPACMSQVMWANNAPNDLMVWGAVLGAIMALISIFLRVVATGKPKRA